MAVTIVNTCTKQRQDDQHVLRDHAGLHQGLVLPVLQVCQGVQQSSVMPPQPDAVVMLYDWKSVHANRAPLLCASRTAATFTVRHAVYNCTKTLHGLAVQATHCAKMSEAGLQWHMGGRH
jgi:hypothetical protein